MLAGAASVLGPAGPAMIATAATAAPGVETAVKFSSGTAPRRLATAPDLPAVAETVPGFEMGVWVGLFAPAGTPRPVVGRLDAATRDALASPELRSRFAELGLEPFAAGPEELGAHLTAEIEKWVMVVRRADIRLD